jgi:hypothetical protein
VEYALSVRLVTEVLRSSNRDEWDSSRVWDAWWELFETGGCECGSYLPQSERRPAMTEIYEGRASIATSHPHLDAYSAAQTKASITRIINY